MNPAPSGASDVVTWAAGAALGTSRKDSVPLVEHLDTMSFTRRIADRRALAGTWLDAPS